MRHICVGVGTPSMSQQTRFTNPIGARWVSAFAPAAVSWPPPVTNRDAMADPAAHDDFVSSAAGALRAQVFG
jgi:hypothetical protein